MDDDDVYGSGYASFMVRSLNEPLFSGRARVYFFNISEHADGERRGSVSISRYLKTCLAETSPMPPSRFGLAPRRSPSACAEKLPKIDPRSGAPEYRKDPKQLVNLDGYISMAVDRHGVRSLLPTSKRSDLF